MQENTFENPEMMACPFCDEELRHGVKVCRGCQAYVTYGYPKLAGFLLLIFAVQVYFSVSQSNLLDPVGILLDLALLFGAYKAATSRKASFERKRFR